MLWHLEYLTRHRHKHCVKGNKLRFNLHPVLKLTWGGGLWGFRSRGRAWCGDCTPGWRGFHWPSLSYRGDKWRRCPFWRGGTRRFVKVFRNVRILKLVYVEVIDVEIIPICICPAGCVTGWRPTSSAICSHFRATSCLFGGVKQSLWFSVYYLNIRQPWSWPQDAIVILVITAPKVEAAGTLVFFLLIQSGFGGGQGGSPGGAWSLNIADETAGVFKDMAVIIHW